MQGRPEAPTVPDLARRIVGLVEEIGRLPRRRGPNYRRLVAELADLCGGNARMVGDLIGVSQQAAWKTIDRSNKDGKAAAATAAAKKRP
jgi:hypothetical protein